MDNRRYERIEERLQCRLYIPEGQKGGLRFEAFGITQNVGLGGVFLESTYLLKDNTRLWVELTLPTQSVAVQARIAHSVGHSDATFPSGMGIEFVQVGAQEREALMRYFTPPRYREFQEALLEEFPHLNKTYSPQTVALLLNLWEEFKVVEGGGSRATASGAPKALPTKRNSKS